MANMQMWDPKIHVTQINIKSLILIIYKQASPVLPFVVKRGFIIWKP